MFPALFLFESCVFFLPKKVFLLYFTKGEVFRKDDKFLINEDCSMRQKVKVTLLLSNTD